MAVAFTLRELPLCSPPVIPPLTPYPLPPYTAVLASVISFTIYGAMKGGLVAADVFSSLALFQLLRLPLMMLPMALSSATDAKNAFGRLEPVRVSSSPFPSHLSSQNLTLSFITALPCRDSQIEPEH
jgi:hypothetical protein